MRINKVFENDEFDSELIPDNVEHRLINSRKNALLHRYDVLTHQLAKALRDTASHVSWASTGLDASEWDKLDMLRRPESVGPKHWDFFIHHQNPARDKIKAICKQMNACLTKHDQYNDKLKSLGMWIGESADEWDNVDMNRMQRNKWLKQKKDALEHLHKVIAYRLNQLYLKHGDDVCEQDFPEGDKPNIYPPRIMLTAKDWEPIKFKTFMLPWDQNSHGMTKYWIRKTRPDLIKRFTKLVDRYHTALKRFVFLVNDVPWHKT